MDLRLSCLREVLGVLEICLTKMLIDLILLKWYRDFSSIISYPLVERIA